MLKAIASYWDEFGWGPSIRDLGKRTGIRSTYMVAYWLKRLEGDGMIIRGERWQSRAIRLTEEGALRAQGSP